MNPRGRRARSDKPLLEFMNDAGVNAGDPVAAEVHAYAIRLPMIQRSPKPRPGIFAAILGPNLWP